jgi:tRNA-2-methylthio-N6-dimethylallyladenosine synthase
MGKKVYLQTFGCQMNVYDSERLQSLLLSEGHRIIKTAEDADIIVLNTCSVREKAETRALGRLSELQKYKHQNPRIMLVVAGCMAQRMGRNLTERMPYLDLVLGPDQIFQLPAYLQNHQDSSRVAVCSSRQDFDSQRIWRQEILPERKTPFTSFVAISRGCDNFCAYCVVPYVRGPERHRPIDQIIKEIQLLVQSGCREVTLIGQNVNSYKFEGKDFADLLQMVNDQTGIDWIRFMTSHPKDLSEKLIDRIAALPKLCEHIHLPLQAGSDRVLEKMNRGYTSPDYLKLVERIKERIENVSLSTDVIVGFPGETKEDFEKTLDMMERVRFDSAFMFRYSMREGTKAASFVDDVPEEEKLSRLHATIRLQKEVSGRKNQGLLGKTFQVLVDERSRRDENRWKGKTKTNKTVIIEGDEDLLGKIVSVKIEEADSFTLFGSPRMEPSRIET